MSDARDSGSGTGWVIAAAVGALLLVGWLQLRHWTQGQLDQVAADGAAQVAADNSLAVTLGRGRDLGSGVTSYPITVANAGPALRYVEADCVFYDKAGGLLDTSMKNWDGARAGETLSGQIYGHVGRPARYVCTAKSHL